jgi:hypothetical protein
MLFSLNNFINSRYKFPFGRTSGALLPWCENIFGNNQAPSAKNGSKQDSERIYACMRAPKNSTPVAQDSSCGLRCLSNTGFSLWQRRTSKPHRLKPMPQKHASLVPRSSRSALLGKRCEKGFVTAAKPNPSACGGTAGSRGVGSIKGARSTNFVSHGYRQTRSKP